MEKVKNRYNNTAIIDADFVIWIACNKNKVVSEGKIQKDEKGRYIYTDKTLQEALDACDGYLRDILNLVKADSYIMYLTGNTNFRHKIDELYKANRVGMERPMWYKEVKQHMIKEWGSILVENVEADDLTRITANCLENSFILAVDKDLLDCTPGNHFDARRTKVQFVNVTKKQADFAFAVSMLCGDSIDGIPNIVRGMGPKTAEEELNKRLGEETYNPLFAAFTMFVSYLGEYEGIKRFSKQYQMLKILENIEQLPEDTKFEIPEPNCWNCQEIIFSEQIIDELGWGFEPLND